MRGLVDRKGEMFGYEENGRLFTLENQPTGSISGDYIVDLAGNKIFRLVGDCLYSLDGMEPFAYLGEEKGSEYL